MEKELRMADFYGAKVEVDSEGRKIITQEAVNNMFSQNIRAADFSNCFIHGVDFRFCSYDHTLSNANFAGSRLEECVFDDMNLTGSCFSGAVLWGARFRQSILKQCDFKRAEILDCIYRETDVVEVDFSGAKISGVTFKDCPIEKNNFLYTVMDNVDIHCADGDGVTPDQLHVETIIYSADGLLDTEKAVRMRDRVMHILSSGEFPKVSGQLQSPLSGRHHCISPEPSAPKL